jgi:hypothetical protein
MVVHQTPVQDYSLDVLTTITDERRPPVEVRVTSRSTGWEQALVSSPAP